MIEFFVIVIVFAFIYHLVNQNPKTGNFYEVKRDYKKKKINYLNEDQHFHKENVDREVDFGYLDDLGNEDFGSHFHND